ncbi:hypothetical protein [Halorussus salinus]|uniref:hypothetical protein n=1 Tax=Halorussus salinus TaxID=1364935 RepID=UPI0010920D1F|nr:hypothetical protein [Halorussus salinus]
MTYLSHTVRSLRDDPIPDEEVRLVLTVEDAPTVEDDADEIESAVESLDGEVVRELAFDRLLVEVAQTDIDAICSLDGISSVETDAVLGPT